MHRPLADEIRPKTLDEVVGQRHLLAPGGVLRRLIDAGTDANMVFYGPSGTGKTTVANIIAEKTHKTLAAFCCIWMRSSISTKSSSKACWNLWRTDP